MPSRRIDQPPSLLLIEAVPGRLAPLAEACPQNRFLRLSLSQAEAAPDLISREAVELVVCASANEVHAGKTLLQQIRHVHPHLPILMVIPNQDFKLALELFRSGADDLLVEPLATAETVGAVARALRQGAERAALNSAQQHVKRSLDELVLLRSVGETASRVENLQRLLERIVISIQAALEVEIVSIMLADANGHLRIHAACGLPDEVRGVKIPIGEGIAGHVYRQGEAVLINDLATDGRFAPRQVGDRYRSGSLLSVPIRYLDRVLGVLNVNNKGNGQGFSGDDQDLLTSIAHQAALAIENLTLISSLQNKTRELERVNADLLRLHHGRTRFVCNLSHELKTPLTSVLGYVDLLASFFGQIEAEQMQEYLERTRDEALVLSRLLNGMLRLFSLDSGLENWHWQELDLAAIITRQLSVCKNSLQERDLSVAVDIADGLAPIWGDSDKLALLLGCLLDNAIKFNLQGGTVAIEAGNRQVDGQPMVYLTIANDGESVPLSAADEIFEAYAQLGDLDTGKPHGVGIGLATCRAILHQLHGRIFLEPHERQGTRFGLFLPTRAAFEEMDHDAGY
ncbi:MAG: hypothetical protein C0614_03005 [Desulfuromonas sp.]|nr:MAG: hypothetical protein C0614_03005 [Desulfuromonas sp.]